MGTAFYKSYPKVVESYPAMTDPHERSFLTEPLDGYFDFEEAWDRTLRFLKASTSPWIESSRLLRETEYEFTTLEKVKEVDRHVLSRHIISPMGNMIESSYYLAKEYPKYMTEDGLFMQWLVLHRDPIRLECWRRSMKNPDTLDMASHTKEAFKSLVQSIVVLQPPDEVEIPLRYDEVEDEEPSKAR